MMKMFNKLQRYNLANIKNIITISLLFVVSGLSAQNNWMKEGKEFDSYFQKTETGHFNGSVTGILLLSTKEGVRSSYVFSDEPVVLDIIPDTNSIYDVSFKYLTIQTDSIKFEYGTYAHANAIALTVDGYRYELNLFDGSCIYVINGLEYNYYQTYDYELLVLNFSDNVGLHPDRCLTDPVFFIRKGSTLIFKIKK